ARDVGGERGGPRGGQVYPAHVRDEAGERVGDLGLADQAEGGDMVPGAPRANRLEPRLLAHRNGLRDEHVLGRAAREVAGELAERAFGLAHAWENLTLDDDLGCRRDV